MADTPRPVTNSSGPAPERPLSALPSPAARAAAFAAILVGGFAGGLIGYTLVKLQCDGDCAVPLGIGMFVGTLVAAAGMSVVAVLVLRALGEWREIERQEATRGAGRR
ncbi:MAG: hypothetical protein U0Q03_22640 [Acidimicrobiales bacterium]